MQSDIFNIKSDEEFEEIALQLFKYQIINNPIYKNYAKLVLKDKTPINIYEIPIGKTQVEAVKIIDSHNFWLSSENEKNGYPYLYKFSIKD